MERPRITPTPGVGRDDVIFGEAGNDALVGGPGQDRFLGGPGEDKSRQ